MATATGPHEIRHTAQVINGRLAHTADGGTPNVATAQDAHTNYGDPPRGLTAAMLKEGAAGARAA